jgi:hypothetical protein
MHQSTPAWKQHPLDKWSICGMNHYRIDGKKCLFVSLVKDGRCITEEGPDDVEIWKNLYYKAMEFEK